jgi:hypothetical protein
MRDGDAKERKAHAEWAVSRFASATTGREDPVHRHRANLRFNKRGIAALGMTAAVHHGDKLSSAENLLELAAKGDPAFAHGFRAADSRLKSIDPRLPVSLLRCAFIGNMRPHLRRYDRSALSEDQARKQTAHERQATAVAAEMRWLTEGGPEPDWPVAPHPDMAEHDEAADSAFYFDDQAAALWLALFMNGELIDSGTLLVIAKRYRDWTSKRNGAGLDRAEQRSSSASDWNTAYFRAVANSLSGMEPDAMDELCVAPLLVLPDDAFLDAVADLLFPLNSAYFNRHAIGEHDMLRMRQKLAGRLEETSNWKNHVWRPSYGCEMHLDGALGHFFFCNRGFHKPPSCYVTPIGIPRMAPFIPLIAELAERGASLVTALMVQSIVSVSMEYPFADLAIGSIRECINRFPDDTKFWSDYSIGKRFCSWLGGQLTEHGIRWLDENGVRSDVEVTISNLIRLGVSEATTIEADLAGNS